MKPVGRNAPIELKLKQMQHRNNAINLLFCFVVMASMISVFLYSYRNYFIEEEKAMRVFLCVSIMLLINFPIVNLGRVLCTVLCKYLAPTYIIDDSADNVLKVFGSIPFDDWQFVKSKLLKSKPGYMLVTDAYEQFGCTMAAIPATPVFLKARSSLAAYDIKI